MDFNPATTAITFVVNGKTPLHVRIHNTPKYKLVDA
jgi:hypothetical protein